MHPCEHLFMKSISKETSLLLVTLPLKCMKEVCFAHISDLEKGGAKKKEVG